MVAVVKTGILHDYCWPIKGDHAGHKINNVNLWSWNQNTGWCETCGCVVQLPDCMTRSEIRKMVN